VLYILPLAKRRKEATHGSAPQQGKNKQRELEGGRGMLERKRRATPQARSNADPPTAGAEARRAVKKERLEEVEVLKKK